MTQRERERAIVAEAIVGAWRDEGYRERLITDGAAVLRDAGLELPAGCRVLVVENTDSVWHLAVPRRDLAESDREQFLAELAALLPLPDGVELHLHQDTGDTRCVVLPLPPGEMDALGDEELKLVVGGGNGGNGGAGGISGTVGTPFGGTAGTGGNGGDGGASILFGGNGGTGAIT